MQNLKIKIQDIIQKLVSVRDLASIDAIRVEYLGKSGELTKAMQKLGSYSVDERKQVGQELNTIKQALTQAIESKIEELTHEELNRTLSAETIDVTLPAREFQATGLHPLSIASAEISQIFKAMGFTLETGPDIEDDFHNFTALNVPEHHPARQMHDTFYMDVDKLLRTHTSTIQIRAMKSSTPPFKFMTIGRVYRYESDRTHTPMFHQVEGVSIDKHITMGDLKGVLIYFLKTFFAQDIDIRFRPSFFPFTEPSAEIDISMDNGKTWLEVLGCGMMHPNVLKNVNIDSNVYQGFAFGMGLERLTMLKYGISDLRDMYDNDIRWLKQYNKSL